MYIPSRMSQRQNIYNNVAQRPRDWFSSDPESVRKTAEAAPLMAAINL